MKEFETNLNNKGVSLIAGIDEAGRGPVAGPVVAASVILDLTKDYSLVNDSKKLSKKKREELYDYISKTAISIGVSIIDIDIIDQINILEATKLAMKEAVNNMDIKPEHLLIDAVKLNSNYNETSIIKGDLKSVSIAAASIIAKVTRDNLMEKYDLIYPNYGFKKHSGYLTKMHKEMINLYGPCEIHRKSFEPIKSIVKFNK
ncbi:ribonuclease HII [Haploplasma modicum]|jgi:ribonuclease HII|uniref:ribonuclease HII n=1 Tax=Haploplasma modicum TaxID=2150 RepID=UPI00214B7298|nr:ribonuclease HII [Haploplasma modicum]MCR1808722.1 ribonuclease HII [Haploplasma modicum]